MSNLPQALQGMSDILSPEVEVWQALESRAREVLSRYDFRELRTPILEEVGVYTHSLGDTSDIVTKQMYAFETRGGKQVCLRPEGTAGVMRHLAGRGQEAIDARLYYIGPMFRAERPQAGRKRQFHQLGVEAMGAPLAELDAEVIALQASIFDAWGLEGVRFQLNTRGSAEDFPKILEGLRGALAPHKEALCEDCQRRMDSNVLRVLDCKIPGCREIVNTLPPITNWMAVESIAYFEKVLAILQRLGVPVEVNSLLVRGLDYYQHSIWEVTSSSLGAQDALSGGGRYRFETGGKSVLEGVGFGIGLERVLLALSEEKKARLTEGGAPLAVLVSLGEAALAANLLLAKQLRDAGCRVRMDLAGRSMKAQMKAADKQGARWTVLRGDQEMERGIVLLRDMSSGVQTEVAADAVAAALRA